MKTQLHKCLRAVIAFTLPAAMFMVVSCNSKAGAKDDSIPVSKAGAKTPEIDIFVIAFPLLYIGKRNCFEQ
jgi:hypothetical protein